MIEPQWQNLPRWGVPFDWRLFWRKQRAMVRGSGLSGSRAGRIASLIGLYSLNQLTWAADQLFAPNWDRMKLNGPVFIIGHQRSGSTLLHRTLARDPNALALTMREMLMPAITGQKLVSAIGRADRRLGGRLAKRLTASQAETAAELDPIHELRLNAIEEDEFLFYFVYRSGMVVNEAPELVGDPLLDIMRDYPSWREKDRRKALGWYRACLLKAAYRADRREPNPDRWIAGKNPAFSQRIPDLLKVFPNAKFIHLVRSPLDTIPSRLSLVRAVWQARHTQFEAMTPAEVETIVADSERTYRKPLEDLAALPKERAITIRFRELVGNVEGTLERIYNQLALPGTPPATAPEDDGLRPSNHRYSLAEFGLDEAALRKRLAPVFEAYGF